MLKNLINACKELFSKGAAKTVEVVEVIKAVDTTFSEQNDVEAFIKSALESSEFNDFCDELKAKGAYHHDELECYYLSSTETARVESLSALVKFYHEKFRENFISWDFLMGEEDFDFAKEFEAKADFYHELYEKVKAYYDGIVSYHNEEYFSALGIEAA